MAESTMTQEQIEQIKVIVSTTVDELLKRQMIDERHQTYIKTAERYLYGFFDAEKKYKGVGEILKTLENDEYIQIIYLRYKDKCTIEEIAETCGKDVSTIKRNRKRLLKKIYTQITRG